MQKFIDINKLTNELMNTEYLKRLKGQAEKAGGVCYLPEEELLSFIMNAIDKKCRLFDVDVIDFANSILKSEMFKKVMSYMSYKEDTNDAREAAIKAIEDNSKMLKLILEKPCFCLEAIDDYKEHRDMFFGDEDLKSGIYFYDIVEERFKDLASEYKDKEREVLKCSCDPDVGNYLKITIYRVFCFRFAQLCQKRERCDSERKSDSERKMESKKKLFRDKIKFFQEGKKEKVRSKSVIKTGSKESVKSIIERINKKNAVVLKEGKSITNKSFEK